MRRARVVSGSSQASLPLLHVEAAALRRPEDVELEFMPLLRQVEHLPLVFDERAG